VAKYQVSEDAAYIRHTDNQVYASPSLDLKLLSDAQTAKLASMELSASDWEQVFADVPAGKFPSWLQQQDQEDDSMKDDELDQESFHLLSPVASKSKNGVFKIVPTFSFDSVNSETASQEDDQRPNLDKKLAKLEGKVVSLKNKLSRPFLDIDASYTVMTTDLVKLHAHMQNIREVIGTSKATETISACLRNLSTKLSVLDNFRDTISLQMQKVKQELAESKNVQEHSMKEIAELQAAGLHLEDWMKATNTTIEVFKRRFQTIKPIFDMFVGSGSKLSTPAETTDVSLLLDQDEVLLKRLADMENKIKILENRVVGAGVHLGGAVFQSFEDLYRGVQTQVLNGRFSLFMDRHSFLEFFTLSGHIDTETGTAAFSHSQKAGFTTYVEAQLAISFKNLFPSVFGKGGSSSMDDSDCFPAISNGDKWNNGSTGIHHQLMRNMNDVTYQISSSIKKVLEDHPEARKLATDCVTASKRFVIDLIAFMSQEYSTWQQCGFTKKQAWRTVCQIVRRIFEDLQSARISARNVQDLEDADFTSASFIYAMMRCHEVMEGYVKHQFHAHPHVASVITRHLAANFIKPDPTGTNNIDNKVTALSTKVDSYVSKVELLIYK
jgi:hypothetical protein